MLTVADAAQRLGVSERRVRQYIEESRLPAQKFGRDWLIREEDLSAFSQQERKTGRPAGGDRDE